MDNNKAKKKPMKIPGNKKLFAQFFSLGDDFEATALKQMAIQEELEEAECLGLKDTLDKIKTNMVFTRNKMFHLHLQLSRVWNLLVQKNKDFTQN